MYLRGLFSKRATDYELPNSFRKLTLSVVHNPEVSICNGMQPPIIERLLLMVNKSNGNTTCSWLDSESIRSVVVIRPNLIGHYLSGSLLLASLSEPSYYLRRLVVLCYIEARELCQIWRVRNIVRWHQKAFLFHISFEFVWRDSEVLEGERFLLFRLPSCFLVLAVHQGHAKFNGESWER